ncbi:MAG TPA: acetylxylan esterase [Bacteroidales bacterium]|nr:acetylxylan esterase [Bacteroidales bacterium]
MKRPFPIFATIILSLFSVVLQAQLPEQLIKIVVSPDHENWQYNSGEKANFTVQVFCHMNYLKGAKAWYEVGPEKLDPFKKDSLILDGKPFKIDAGTLKSPGFLRCIVTVEYEGKKYRGLATAGFDVDQIRATVKLPEDFTEFWDAAKKELSGIPVNARMTLMPERCTENVNVYHVSLQNIGNSRIYGIVSIPRKEGKYPAILEVPGAGVRAYAPDISLAERGVITFVIGIHGIPVNLDPGVYLDLGNGALREYWTFNMDNRDRYYYKRVYLGCVRANDFLTSLPQYDGANLAVTGGSQGGALSIITASLDTRVKCLGSFYPALCDVTGYLSGRAGGWPHFFNKNSRNFHDTREKLETIAYYDVVNFARNIKVPGFYSWGFNDETCPPTSMYAAYNLISAEKNLNLFLETGHWTYPEQNNKMQSWILGMLTKN